MPHTKEQANAEIEAALPVLVGFDMPSTRHMSQGEREDAIGQMLADLWMLAKNDGCIAAAWAYELCVNLKPYGQWREIKTAPKDGSQLQLAKIFPKTGTIHACDGYWTEHNGGGWVRSMYYDPSHWMPLPEPPKEPANV